MQLSNLIADYMKKKGAFFTPTTTGVTTLRINDDFLISIEESLDGRSVFLYSAIAYVPIGKAGDILRLKALSGNLFGRETGNLNLGYDEVTESLVLFERLDKETLTAKILEDQLESFTAYHAYWVAKLQETDKGGTKAETLRPPLEKKILYP